MIRTASCLKMKNILLTAGPSNKNVCFLQKNVGK